MRTGGDNRKMKVRSSQKQWIAPEMQLQVNKAMVFFTQACFWPLERCSALPYPSSQHFQKSVVIFIIIFTVYGV